LPLKSFSKIYNPHSVHRLPTLPTKFFTDGYALTVTDEFIKKRCIVLIEDYEPIDIAQRFAMFQKGLRQFMQTWHVAVRFSSVKMAANNVVAVWHVETKAPNWQVNTEFRLLNWSDLVKGDFRRWRFDRILRAGKAFANFVISGTCWRYVRTSWRFGLLFLYPVLAAFLFSVVGLVLAVLLATLNVPFALLIGLIFGVGLFAAYVKWLDPFELPRVVDLWVFLYDLVHLKRTGLPERLGVFSQDIIAKLQSNDYDEIVVIGHGIGAALQPIILDRVFFALPNFDKRDGRSVNVLSLGSLLLAVGLHPDGAWLVSPTLRIAVDRMVYWAEYQAVEDIFSFAGRNPVAELAEEHGEPILQRIRIKDMVDSAGKRRFRDATYQNHLQPIRANSKRYFYDYFMVCCGPFALPTRVNYADHMVSAFAPDGRLNSNS